MAKRKDTESNHYYDALIKNNLCMEFKIIYVLTVRCTDHKCEEDLACYPIYEIDEAFVYAADKKYAINKLAGVETIEKNNGLMILRVPFLIKEAAIVWVRDVFIEIFKHGTPRMKEAVRTEWMRIISPEYDCRWFTGGEKVEQWKEEMKSIVEKL